MPEKYLEVSAELQAAGHYHGFVMLGPKIAASCHHAHRTYGRRSDAPERPGPRLSGAGRD